MLASGHGLTDLCRLIPIDDNKTTSHIMLWLIAAVANEKLFGDPCPTRRIGSTFNFPLIDNKKYS